MTELRTQTPDSPVYPKKRARPKFSVFSPIFSLSTNNSFPFQLICFCFEGQFDECIVDRPLIVNAIKILLTQLPEEQTLSFDFFIQRFETLVLEAQLNSQSEETVFVQGFPNFLRFRTFYRFNAL